MRFQTKGTSLAALLITLGAAITPAFAMLQPTGDEAGGGGTETGTSGSAGPSSSAPITVPGISAGLQALAIIPGGGGMQDTGTAGDQADPMDLDETEVGAAGAGAGAGVFVGAGPVAGAGAGAGAGIGTGAGHRAQTVAARQRREAIRTELWAWCVANINPDHDYTADELKELAKAENWTMKQIRTLVINYKQRIRGPQ